MRKEKNIKFYLIWEKYVFSSSDERKGKNKCYSLILRENQTLDMVWTPL